MIRERGEPRQCGWIWHYQSNVGELPAEDGDSLTHTFIVPNPDNCPCIWYYFSVSLGPNITLQAVTPPAQICFPNGYPSVAYAGPMRYAFSSPIFFPRIPVTGDLHIGPYPSAAYWGIVDDVTLQPSVPGDYRFTVHLNFADRKVCTSSVYLTTTPLPFEIVRFQITPPAPQLLPVTFTASAIVSLGTGRLECLLDYNSGGGDSTLDAGSYWLLEKLGP